jgi:hypothetical protein
MLRAKGARSVEALSQELPGVLNAVSAQNAQEWFRHYGYATPN